MNDQDEYETVSPGVRGQPAKGGRAAGAVRCGAVRWWVDRSSTGTGPRGLAAMQRWILGSVWFYSFVG